MVQFIQNHNLPDEIIQKIFTYIPVDAHKRRLHDELKRIVFIKKKLGEMNYNIEERGCMKVNIIQIWFVYYVCQWLEEHKKAYTRKSLFIGENTQRKKVVAHGIKHLSTLSEEEFEKCINYACKQMSVCYWI